MTTFPVTASTLSAHELGQFIIERYGLSKDGSCSLFRTGINHTYFIKEREAKYVLRVYSCNWRSKHEIQEEIRFLTLLKEHNISISYPIPDVNGEFIQEINAPEGVRYAVLFSFAEGEKVRFMNKVACFKVGTLMAQMHTIVAGQTIERIYYNSNTLLDQPYTDVKQYFSEELPDMMFLKELGKHIEHYFAENQLDATGIVHLDIWYDNMSITKEGKATLFDFDFCGNGPLILDIAYFCKQLFHIEANKEDYEQKAAHFLNGYQSIKKLSEGELSMLPYAGAAVYIFYLGVQCRRYDWSNIFLTENYLKMYTERIRSWIEYNKAKENIPAINL